MHLLLHIGPPKTGSTAIQKGLELNSEVLKEAGILPLFYKASKVDPFPRHALGARHSADYFLKKWPIPQKFKTPQSARDWSKRHWDALSTTIQDSDADLCVISSEYLSYGVDVPGLLADFRKIFTGITVVAYVREPAALYFSTLQQNIQAGRKLSQLRTPESYPYRQRVDIEKYANALGAENVVVRNFSRDNLKGGDVVQDFFSQFERFGKVVSTGPVQANESLPGAALALLLMINEASGKNERPRPRQWLFQRFNASQAVAQLPSFSPKLPLARTLIRTRAAEDCDWLNRIFLSGQELLPVETGPVPEFSGDDAWRAELRDIFLSYLTPAALAALGPELMNL